MEPVKSEHFVVVFDKEREKAFKAMMMICTDDRVGMDFAKTLRENGVQQVFLDLLMEMSDKTHDLGWCTDPECKYKSKKQRENE